MTLPGVDVSSYQGPPGAWRAEAGAISWAGVKITELSVAGPYTNPDAGADWAWLGANSKGRIGYMFGHPAVGAAASAGLFLAELTRIGFTDHDGVCLDLETTDGRTGAQVAGWAAEVLALLQERTGRAPVLYVNLSYAAAYGRHLSRFPLWVSDPSSAPGFPRVPVPWKAWTIHQHTITGPIDRDVANFTTLTGMRAVIGKPAPKPHPKPVPVPKPAGPSLITTMEDPMLPLLPHGTPTPVPIIPAAKGVRVCLNAPGKADVDFVDGKPGYELVFASRGNQDVAIPAGKTSAFITLAVTSDSDVAGAVALI